MKRSSMIRSMIRRMVHWSALSIYPYTIVNMATGATVLGRVWVRGGNINTVFKILR